MKFSAGDVVQIQSSSPRNGSIWIVLAIRPYANGLGGKKQIEWSVINSDGVLHEDYVLGERI